MDLRGGEVHSLLGSWGDPGLPYGERAVSRDLLRENLLDPRDLLDPGILPEGDPLLLEARALAPALEEAAAGGLSPEARMGLRVVGRPREELPPRRSLLSCASSAC